MLSIYLSVTEDDTKPLYPIFSPRRRSQAANRKLLNNESPKASQLLEDTSNCKTIAYSYQ